MNGFVSNALLAEIKLRSFILKFIYFERERERERERECVSGGGVERERESQAGSQLSVQSPTWGSVSQTMRS